MSLHWASGSSGVGGWFTAPMYSDGPKRLYPAQLRLLETCPASALPRRTKRPDNALTRWKVVMEAITQWYAVGTPEDVTQIEADLMGALDRVQRELCGAAFRAWRDRVGSDGQVSYDAVWPSVQSPDGRHYLAVPIQLALTQDDGTIEHIKLKLRTPTTDDERAVITLGAEPGVDYLEVLLDPGQVDSLKIETEPAALLVAELFAIGAAEIDKNTYNGGFHCWRCERASLCKQYSPLGPGHPPSGTRSVVLGKGTLARLSECARRVAWKSIFQIADDRSDFDEDSPALAMGSHFHEAIAVALTDDDPDGVMTAQARPLAGSEQAEFLGLWERHKAVATRADHSIKVSRTELPIGCTAPAPTTEDTTAITFLGIVDAAGRESDGTPVVIEHRTTMRRDLPHLEQELYAVAGALAVKSDRIAVHHHWLRSPLEEACTRRLFEQEDLQRASAALVEAAVEIAGWDREDATSAPFCTGEWCRYCPYQTLCSRHRD